MKKSIRSRALAQSGLTLVEIIVVLVILSVLIAFLTGGLFSQAEGAKVKVTQMKLEKLKNAINQYQLMNNQLPASPQALVNCENAKGGCVPVAQDEDLKDAWGTPIQMSLDGGGRNYTLKSAGADRREGGSGVDGDISVTGP